MMTNAFPRIDNQKYNVSKLLDRYIKCDTGFENEDIDRKFVASVLDALWSRLPINFVIDINYSNMTTASRSVRKNGEWVTEEYSVVTGEFVSGGKSFEVIKRFFNNEIKMDITDATSVYFIKLFGDYDIQNKTYDELPEGLKFRLYRRITEADVNVTTFQPMGSDLSSVARKNELLIAYKIANGIS